MIERRIKKQIKSKYLKRESLCTAEDIFFYGHRGILSQQTRNVVVSPGTEDEFEVKVICEESQRLTAFTVETASAGDVMVFIVYDKLIESNRIKVMDFISTERYILSRIS